MTEPNPLVDPPVNPPADPPASLTAAEVKSLVGETLDERLNALGGTLSKLDLLDGLDDRIEGIVSKHKSASPDNKGLLAEIDNLVTNRLREAGANVGRKVGPLGRWLAPKSD